MTTKPAIYEVRELDRAEELLAELAPATGTLWHDEFDTWPMESWIFRGQANDAAGRIWKLSPSAFRPNAFLNFTRAAYKQPRFDADEQRSFESLVVKEYAAVVDRHGFEIPHDSPTMRDLEVLRTHRHNDWPPRELYALIALAQHYGLPTRLLDWTWKPLVAVYFAVESVAKRGVPGAPSQKAEAPFSVFALRTSIADATEDLDPAVRIVRAPTKSNANLHAQGGVFTLVQPRDVDEHPLPTLDDVLTRHAGQIAEVLHPRMFRMGSRFPLLIEYRVPAAEARCMLWLLARMGVTAASVFPDLGGCARAMHEDRYHMTPDVRDRFRTNHGTGV